MQTKRFIYQAFTMLMAAMLLLVAGAKSWSVSKDAIQKHVLAAKAAHQHAGDENQSPLPEGEQAKVSTLSLDAVITPAISFDFYQYFYFLPQQVWSFVRTESILEIAFKTPIYLFSCFSRIFGCNIVTNAP